MSDPFGPALPKTRKTALQLVAHYLATGDDSPTFDIIRQGDSHEASLCGSGGDYLSRFEYFVFRCQEAGRGCHIV